MTSAAILSFDPPPGGALRERLALLAALLARSDDTSVPAAGTSDALRSKDPGAWRAFFETEMPAIFRYARARLGTPEEAEDVTSQVFEEAWRSVKSFQDQGLPPRAWLFGVARNVVSSHRRRLSRKPPHLTLDAVNLSTTDTATRPELLDLARAIAGLEPSQAEVITLRFIHGLSLLETAGALSTTVDGIKGRQARALSTLKDRMSAPVLRESKVLSRDSDRSRAS